MNDYEVIKGKLIYKGHAYLGDIYLEVDGYYVYHPGNKGHFNSRVLRDIADLLDEMNEGDDKFVRENLGM